MEPYLQQLAYETMLKDLKSMSENMINTQLSSMGCGYSYEQIKEKLATTYNDLSVADEVFSNFTITGKTYPVAFIDEAILEIATRENFGFTHYGILSSRIRDIINLEGSSTNKLDELEIQYRKLCTLALRFDMHSLEAMAYQVNDGIDLYAILMETLDQMLQLGSVDASWYGKLVRFCDKLLTTFTQSGPYIRASIQYEQATGYIVQKSKKGDQIFEELLQHHEDPTDVLLHYVLAYMEVDEKKAIRLLKAKKAYWNPESDAYEQLMSIITDGEHWR